MRDDKIPLYMICAFSLFHYTAVGVIRNFIPLHTEALGAPPHITGAVVASFAFLPLFLSIPGGSIIDRVGSGNVAAVAGLLMITASAILVLFPRVILVALAQLLLGLAHVLVAISTQAYVSKLGRTHHRASNFGFYSFITALGFMLGPLIGGTLADLWDFSATFAGAGVLSVGTALVATRLPRPSAEEREPAKEETDPPPSFRRLLREGRDLMQSTPARLSVFVSMCALFGLAIRTSFYPVYLEGIGFSAGPIGILISIQSGVGLILRPLLGTLLNHFHFMHLLIGALTIGTFGLSVTPFLIDFAPLALFAVIAGITTSLTQPISMILMAEGSGQKQRGLAMSLRLTGNRVVMLVGPATLGLVASLLGVRLSFIFASAVLLMGAITLVVWNRLDSADIRLESG